MVFEKAILLKKLGIVGAMNKKFPQKSTNIGVILRKIGAKSFDAEVKSSNIGARKRKIGALNSNFGAKSSDIGVRKRNIGARNSNLVLRAPILIQGVTLSLTLNRSSKTCK